MFPIFTPKLKIQNENQFEQEALEVLRTAPNVVNLRVCRPHDEQFRKLSPPTEPPKPPQRSQHTNVQQQQQQQQQEPQSPLHKTFTGVSKAAAYTFYR